MSEDTKKVDSNLEEDPQRKDKGPIKVQRRGYAIADMWCCSPSEVKAWVGAERVGPEELGAFYHGVPYYSIVVANLFHYVRFLLDGLLVLWGKENGQRVSRKQAYHQMAQDFESLASSVADLRESTAVMGDGGAFSEEPSIKDDGVFFVKVPGNEDTGDFLKGMQEKMKTREKSEKPESKQLNWASRVEARDYCLTQGLPPDFVEETARQVIDFYNKKNAVLPGTDEDLRRDSFVAGVASTLQQSWGHEVALLLGYLCEALIGLPCRLDAFEKDLRTSLGSSIISDVTPIQKEKAEDPGPVPRIGKPTREEEKPYNGYKEPCDKAEPLKKSCKAVCSSRDLSSAYVIEQILALIEMGKSTGIHPTVVLTAISQMVP